MITLKDSISINSPPEKILDFLTHLEENYQLWHPDHIKCENIGGGEEEKDSVLYFEEYLHGKVHKFKAHITRKELGIIEYDLMIGVKGSFLIQKQENNSVFTAEIKIKLPIIEYIITKFFNNYIESIKQHMNEEGIRLKKIMEEGYKVKFT